MAVVEVTSQVVLHPVVSHSLKVWSTTLGRDKTYRAIQYFARFYAWYLINAGNKDDAVKWNALKSHLATARKLMRLFKPLEHLQAAVKAAQSPALYQPGTTIERWTAIGRQLAYAGYLGFDSLVWIQQVKFVNFGPARAQKFLDTSLRFWLAGIVIGIINGLVKAGRLANRAKELSAPSKVGEKTIADDAQRKATLATIEKERAAVRYQLLIDSLDVWLPATGLGVVNVNDGAAGILGFITSLMAFRSQWIALG